MSVDRELYGDSSRVITDKNARGISRVEELSYDLKVRDVMSQELTTVTRDLPMSEVLILLRQRRISGMPVVEEGRMIGIISIEDAVRALGANDLDGPIGKYMTSDVLTVNEFDPVIRALEIFTRSGLGRLPVLNQDGILIGMLTKGDITRGIMMALQKDYQAEELRRYRASHLFEDIHSDRTTLVLRYHIKAGDFTRGGNASSSIKRALLRLGADPQIARRCGIAIYEAEMNLIIHTTNGGIIKVEVEPPRIKMQAIDDGPGIDDVGKAMQAGYSTATEQVRELGFGAGMGLVNIKRYVDDFLMESTLGKGTRLEMKIYLPEHPHKEDNE
jgi:CBS domain-containing protein/anti-sigma regulatory factor (Ser/Thr protein kinase)